MPPETPAERRWRMYSAGYRGGQRLSSYPDALAESERERAETETDSYFVLLGAIDYHEGFSDGWHGHIPAVETPLRWEGYE